MLYVWEFEFFDSDGVVDAVPCGSLGVLASENISQI